MDARKQAIQKAAADLANEIVLQEEKFDLSYINTRKTHLVDELKLDEQEYQALNKSFNDELMKAMVDHVIQNEMIAHSRVLSEKDIQSKIERLKQLQLEGKNWDDFADALRSRLEHIMIDEARERKHSDQIHTAIDATITNITIMKPRNALEEWDEEKESKEYFDVREKKPICPIMQTPLEEKDTVAISDGYLYNREAIARWARDHNESPNRKIFTDGDKNRINGAQPDILQPYRVSDNAMMGASALAVAITFFAGLCLMLAGIFLPLFAPIALPLAVILPPIGLKIYEKYQNSKRRAEHREFQQEAEGVEGLPQHQAPQVQHRNSLNRIIQQARREDAPHARPEGVEMVELKEQKPRRNSLPAHASMFAHAELAPLHTHEEKLDKDKVVGEEKMVPKRRYTQ